MHRLRQRHNDLVGEAVEAVTHHGVALFQGVGAEVGAALHHLFTDGGDTGRRQLGGQEMPGDFSVEDGGDIAIGQLKIRAAGAQARTGGGDRLGAEQGAQATGELVLAFDSVIQHEAGRAAFRPAQGQFVGYQLVLVQPGVGELALHHGFCLECAQRLVYECLGVLEHWPCLLK